MKQWYCPECRVQFGNMERVYCPQGHGVWIADSPSMLEAQYRLERAERKHARLEEENLRLIRRLPLRLTAAESACLVH